MKGNNNIFFRHFPLDVCPPPRSNSFRRHWSSHNRVVTQQVQFGLKISDQEQAAVGTFGVERSGIAFQISPRKVCEDALAFLRFADENQLPQKLTECQVQGQAGKVKMADVLGADQVRKLIPEMAKINQSVRQSINILLLRKIYVQQDVVAGSTATHNSPFLPHRWPKPSPALIEGWPG